MGRLGRSSQVRDRQSIWYDSTIAVHYDKELRKRLSNAKGLLPDMLLEDVRLLIMPVGGQSRNSDFRVHWSSSEADVERLVACALDSLGSGRDLARAVCTFVSQCAENILIYGAPVYEIIYLRNEKDSITGFQIDPISPQAFRRHRGQLVQFVPPEVAKERGVPGSIALSPDHTIVFKPPERMRADLDKMMVSLAQLSKAPGFPEFDLQNLAGTAKHVPFDLNSYSRTEHVAMAKVSNPIGWNARGLFVNDILDYYRARRHLRFERFLIWLRHSILEQLNQGLSHAGRVMGFEGFLCVEGLPDLQDLQTAEAELESGVLHPEQAVKRFQF